MVHIDFNAEHPNLDGQNNSLSGLMSLLKLLTERFMENLDCEKADF